VLNLTGESYLRDKRKAGVALPSPAQLATETVSAETEADRAAEPRQRLGRPTERPDGSASSIIHI